MAEEHTLFPKRYQIIVYQINKH
uniref:Uncharacterized protein n=1 Tax=Anguilla anguilla TaxID=7936 RepID=A0A0E9U448_ANGAN